ncbi:MAG: hypothetical protein WD598_01705 [Acidimicrobiia bacterium]
MAVLVTVLAVVMALLAVLVAGLLRSHAEILRALHGLGAGLDPDAEGDATPTHLGVTVPRPRAEPRAAADVSGTTPSGDAVSVSISGARHSTLLAFLTTGCTTCADFWSAFANPDGLRVPGDARLLVVTKGEEAESVTRVRKFAPRDLSVVMSSEAWDAYDVPVAPYFAYVDGPTSAIVGEGAAMTWEHLVGMMEQAIADAGLSTSGRGGRRRRAGGRAREARADADLLRAGIEPGHPSLYPTSEDDLHDSGGPE